MRLPCGWLIIAQRVRRGAKTGWPILLDPASVPYFSLQFNLDVCYAHFSFEKLGVTYDCAFPQPVTLTSFSVLVELRLQRRALSGKQGDSQHWRKICGRRLSSVDCSRIDCRQICIAGNGAMRIRSNEETPCGARQSKQHRQRLH